MFTTKPARHKRPLLHSASSRSTSHKSKSTQSSLIQRITRFFIVAVIVIIISLIAGYLLYTAILSNAIKLPEPQTIVLVPHSLDSSESRVLVVHVAPEMTDSYIVSIPGNQEVQLPAGYGTYRLSAIYPLLTIDKKDAQFLTASFSRSLGIIVDDVYGLESLNFGEVTFSRDIFHLVTQQLWQSHTLRLEAIKLWYFARKGIPLEHADSITQVQQIIEKHRKNNYSFQECPIGVLNASGQAGAAGTLSDLFEKSGLLAIRTSSYPSDEPTTTIYHDGKETCNKVLDMTEHVFVQHPEMKLDTSITTQYRAPIVVLIGKDFE
jgi:hypothetical protein